MDEDVIPRGHAHLLDFWRRGCPIFEGNSSEVGSILVAKKQCQNWEGVIPTLIILPTKHTLGISPSALVRTICPIYFSTLLVFFYMDYESLCLQRFKKKLLKEEVVAHQISELEEERTVVF